MILILDTDHVTTIQRQSEPLYTKLITRLRKVKEQQRLHDDH